MRVNTRFAEFRNTPARPPALRPAHPPHPPSTLAPQTSSPRPTSPRANHPFALTPPPRHAQPMPILEPRLSRLTPHVSRLTSPQEVTKEPANKSAKKWQEVSRSQQEVPAPRFELTSCDFLKKCFFNIAQDKKSCGTRGPLQPHPSTLSPSPRNQPPTAPPLPAE